MIRFAVLSSIRSFHHECYGFWIDFAYRRGYQIDLFIRTESACEEGWPRIMDEAFSKKHPLLHRWHSIDDISRLSLPKYDVIVVGSDCDQVLAQIEKQCPEQAHRIISFQHGAVRSPFDLKITRLSSIPKKEFSRTRTAFLSQVDIVPSPSMKLALTSRSPDLRLLMVGARALDAQVLSRLQSSSGRRVHLIHAARLKSTLLRKACLSHGISFEERLNLGASEMLELASGCSHMLVAKAPASMYMHSNMSGMLPLALSTLCRIVCPLGIANGLDLGASVYYTHNTTEPVFLDDPDTESLLEIQETSERLRTEAFRALDDCFGTIIPSPAAGGPSLVDGDRGVDVIPKCIHLVWLSRLVWNVDFSAHQQTLVNRWRSLHPDWEVKTWTQDRLEGALYASTPGLLDTYQKLQTHEQRSAFAAAFVVWKFGGMFCSLEIEPLKPLDSLVRMKDSFFVRNLTEQLKSDTLTGCIFGAKRAHPVLKHVMYCAAKGLLNLGDAIRAFNSGRPLESQVRFENVQGNLLAITPTGELSKDYDARYALLAYRVSSLPSQIKVNHTQIKEHFNSRGLQEKMIPLLNPSRRPGKIALIASISVVAALMLGVVIWLATVVAAKRRAVSVIK